MLFEGDTELTSNGWVKASQIRFVKLHFNMADFKVMWITSRSNHARITCTVEFSSFEALKINLCESQFAVQSNEDSKQGF